MRDWIAVAVAAALVAGCASARTAAPAPQSTPAPAASPAPVSVDFFAGEWAIHDATGAAVGRATIVVQYPAAMLYELRSIGQAAAQPLWFANSERAGGWTQLFLNPAGQVREFVTVSPAGEWPLVLRGDATLRDGARATFRLTISRTSDEETRRLLETSRDAGRSWTTVLDYTYRRLAR